MSDLKIIRLNDHLFEPWCRFVEEAYGPAHVLTDHVHLKWFLTDPRLDFAQNSSFHSLVAIEGDRIVGTYGALPRQLRIDHHDYSFCWFVSGIVLPDQRGRGIGQKFIDQLLNDFEVCGVLSFNSGVQKNYERFGFNLLGQRPLRKFIAVLDPRAYELVRRLGFDPARAEAQFPQLQEPAGGANGVRYVDQFEPSADGAYLSMLERHRVMVPRDSASLNRRYVQNPRLKYEITVTENQTPAYLVSRREVFQPTTLAGTRVVDLAGSPEAAKGLLREVIERAFARGDSLIDISFSSDLYAEVLTQMGFTELNDDTYRWWPSTSSPIESRENHEWMCLGSRKIPELIASLTSEDVYFTRGDSDRDRATGVGEHGYNRRD